MKTLSILTLLLLINFVALAQIDSRRGLDYLAEYADTSMLYSDVFCNNYNDMPVSAIGNNRTEAVVHYSSSVHCGERLYMISVQRNISAVNYTELFIYDDYQNLINYVYLMDDVELIYKLDPAKINDIEVVSEKNRPNFSDNYFIQSPDEFFYWSSVKSRENSYLSKYGNVFQSFPDVETEVLKIRELYNKTVNDKQLVKQTKEEGTLYFAGKDLVKVVMTDERTYEIYLNNGSIYFIYSSAWNDIPDLRIYCYNNNPFKILYGKDQLKKSDERFCEYSGFVQSLNYNLEELISK